MPTSRLILIAVIVALAFGIAATLALRTTGRRRLEATAGIRALAAMRWREFSQFVVTALQAQGFDAAPLTEDGAGTRDSADLLLRRNDRAWLLTCRQSPDYCVTTKQVDEMARALRQRGAVGGVIATLGRVDRKARQTAERVEFVDGPSLWELIAPLLPAGLQDHINERVQRRERNALLGAWLAAPVLGAIVALLLALFTHGDATPPKASAPVAAAPAAQDAPPPAPEAIDAPAATIAGDDDSIRQAVLDAVNAIDGVDRSVWSTRSTLLVLLESEGANVRDGVCNVLERYDALRTSRVQLQAPSGSAAPVRFMQCRVY